MIEPKTDSRTVAFLEDHLRLMSVPFTVTVLVTLVGVAVAGDTGCTGCSGP